MHDNLVHPKDKSADEPIVIADECGDSMWEAVLAQKVKTCDLKEMPGNISLLLNSNKEAQACDSTVAK